MNTTYQGDRIERHTSRKSLDRIHFTTLENVQKYSAHSQMMSSRIEHLRKERDVERILETNATIFALITVLLTLFVHINWIYVTLVVLILLLVHSIVGWCPPLPVVRKLGKRTRHEIEEERHALKALRGDYINVTNAEEAYRSAEKD